MSDAVQPNRWQPTWLPHPWDSPGKNTGLGCHFLLQCMKVESESEVAQLCPTFSDPMDCSLPGSSIHGIIPGKSTGVGCHFPSVSPTFDIAIQCFGYLTLHPWRTDTLIENLHYMLTTPLGNSQ